MTEVLHYFCWGDAVTESRRSKALVKLKDVTQPGIEIQKVDCEVCFNVAVSSGLTKEENDQMQWLFADHAKEGCHGSSTSFASTSGEVIEVGPRLNVQTPFSTNALAICKSIGLTKVTRVECTRRYNVVANCGSLPFPKQQLSAVLFDRMTECLFTSPIQSFALDVKKEEWDYVDVMGCGAQALIEASDKLGLAFDKFDIEYYTKLFKETIKRNPTTVECFDLSQSNSEHSRHWFFCGRQVIDEVEQPKSLMKMVKATQVLPNNSVIAFHDNSSAMTGYDELDLLRPSKPDAASAFVMEKGKRDITLTAETHNFPTGVAPFPGATTGTGGRIRDNQSTGRGANVIAGTSGYCVGNLNVPGYKLQWEDDTFTYPSNMATPLDIEIEASNGASDYGNKFGEPVIVGYTRSFGMRMEDGDRREWVKPIMFSAGIGSMDPQHLTKKAAQPGNLMVKVGGPAYRIGMGGGSASSVDVQGDQNRDADLDFNAVQRGDAEMEQKLNRVIRACVEMGDSNIICSIHDQGCGGNGNVLKEICEPCGAIIRVKDFVIGDPTLSTMELWGAEYQENNAILLDPADKELLTSICERERVPVAFVGEVTDSGRVVLEDDPSTSTQTQKTQHPYDMSLGQVLTGLPPKVFKSDRAKLNLNPFQIPASETVSSALGRVLRLLSVGSKRFLTNKVDRSVTGLIAQQQCVGPLHIPLSNVGVIALSHLDTKGAATSIGEQPIKMMVDIAAGSRMTVAEGLTNIVWAQISDLKDIKCSGNWMWAAKLKNEGAALFDACKAMCDIVTELGFALDGGKDSLSMAARVPAEEHPVKAPGELVMSLYGPCPDVTLTVTPDLEPMINTSIILVDPSGGKCRLGGSALAQCYKQIGAESPDVDCVKTLENVFRATQTLISERGLVLAGHDRSDGGLITALIEMAISGNCGMDISLDASSDELGVLFGEELGLLLQVRNSDLDRVISSYSTTGAVCKKIGTVSDATGKAAKIKISVGDNIVVHEAMVDLRDQWEETSFVLEKRQSKATCVAQEQSGLRERSAPPFKMTFEPAATSATLKEKNQQVAIIREEGSNGDREMVAALHIAGFTVTDVTMQDIQNGTITLDAFRGVVFVGGFSFADTCGSAKGWAAGILMNPRALAEFDKFKNRVNTFSLGICNGCQLLGLLGWVGDASSSDEQVVKRAKTDTSSFDRAKAVFTHNESGRFESRFSTVQIQESPSLMLKDMQGSTLGVWVAHGEGRARFLNDSGLSDCVSNNLAPIRYVDDDNKPTMAYPLNPNGSPEGIAALCSLDGRHLAMMPHPERCVLPWQWPWMPAEWKEKNMPVSPWMKMFQNAKQWCDSN